MYKKKKTNLIQLYQQMPNEILEFPHDTMQK